MAKLIILKPGEKSQKKDYKPTSIKYKQYLYLSIILNVGLTISLIATMVNYGR